MDKSNIKRRQIIIEIPIGCGFTGSKFCTVKRNRCCANCKYLFDCIEKAWPTGYIGIDELCNYNNDVCCLAIFDWFRDLNKMDTMLFKSGRLKIKLNGKFLIEMKNR